MTYGVKAFRKLQLARLADSDSDDFIPATTILRANGTIEDTRNLYQVKEDVGIAIGTDRTNTSILGGKITIDAIEATYEQFPHFLEMSIGKATPYSASDSGDGYVYQYTIPTTTFAALQPYSLEGGDNAGAEAVNFVHCSDWTLAGAGGKAWMMSANLFGKSVIPQAFTLNVSMPAINTANFGSTLIYIDNDSDTWGANLASTKVLGVSLKFNANLVAKQNANGSNPPVFGYVVQTTPTFTATVTFEHDTGVLPEKINWRAETPRLIRILNQGPLFTNQGTTYARRIIQADLAGKWMKFGRIGEQNGNDVVEGTFEVHYNEAQASAGQILVVNSLASLP